MKKMYINLCQYRFLGSRLNFRFILPMVIIMVLCGIKVDGQILWSTPTGQAWLTGSNWVGGTTPTNIQYAQFGTAPTGGVTGVGINMNGITNNGVNNQAVGAIEVTSARSVNMLIGNSSSTVNGILTINGATINSINNVILRNNSSGLLTIQNTQALGDKTMEIALNNTTDNLVNIDGTGGITISSIISGAGRNLTLNGGGTGVLTFTASNTYSGLTTVSANTLRLNNAGGGTLPNTNNTTINGTGNLQVSTNQTINNFTMTGGMLTVDAGVVLTITGAYNVTGGTINNQGTIKLNGGATSFPGTGVTINNGTAGTMTNLEIATSGNVTQTASFFIGGTLTLTSGIINSTLLNSITINSGGIVTGTSNNSFVDGPISKIGNTAFTFPVGKPNCGPTGLLNGYAALVISNFTGGAVTDKFTAEYKRGSALVLGVISALGVNHVSLCDYWTLTRDNGASTVDIILSWDNLINNCITSATYVNNRPALTIAHNDNLGGTWDANGVAGVTTGTNAIGTVSWSGVQSATFGAFAIASVDFTNPLPINLNYLNGYKQSGNHNLNWKVTCTNNATATMSVERSATGRNFTTINTITADALRCQQPFNYTDANPLQGSNYYRLKMTDANGKVTYSVVIVLLNAATGFDIVGLLPNLIKSNAILNVTAAQKTKMDVVITDMVGRQVQKIAYNLIAGSNQFTINLANLMAGTYQITGYTTEGKSKTIRFTKE